MLESSSPRSPHSPGSPNAIDDLARVFNTALISTRESASADVVQALYQTMETPAFQAILGAIRSHAKTSSISDREAAESLVITFRKIDRLWSEYLVLEGADRLKSTL